MRRRSAEVCALVVACCACLVPLPACAMQLLHADAAYEKGVFRISFQARLAAPVAGVATVLGDFANYGKLDSRIRSVKLLQAQPADEVLLRTSIHACAGVFCRTVERVERVQMKPDGLVAVIVPERSDIRRGMARTRWEPQGAGTLLSYEAEFKPDFWVPSLIAERLGVRELRESTLRMFESVERAANGR